MYILWAITAILIGLILISLEACIPSGGILTFLSITSFVVGLIFAYMQSTTFGTTLIFSTIVLIPLTITLVLKIVPETRIGKILFAQNILPPSDPSGDHDHSRKSKLIGQLGIAKSLMIPSGAVEVEGELIDAVSLHGTIEAGQLVRVIEIKSNRIIVELEETSEISDKFSGQDSNKPLIDDLKITQEYNPQDEKSADKLVSEDTLNANIESLNLDSFSNQFSDDKESES